MFFSKKERPRKRLSLRGLCQIGFERFTTKVVAGARNHLPANRSLGFCFEIPI